MDNELSLYTLNEKLNNCLYVTGGEMQLDATITFSGTGDFLTKISNDEIDTNDLNVRNICNINNEYLYIHVTDNKLNIEADLGIDFNGASLSSINSISSAGNSFSINDNGSAKLTSINTSKDDWSISDGGTINCRTINLSGDDESMTINSMGIDGNSNSSINNFSIISTNNLIVGNDAKIDGNITANTISATTIEENDISLEDKYQNKHFILIATYNTESSFKNNADYVCTNTNVNSVIQEAIDNLSSGGKIILLDGNYQLTDTINITKQGITIEGVGYTTIINQFNDGSGETNTCFSITGINVTLKNMMISAANVNSPKPLILQGNEGITYDNVFFVVNVSYEDPGAGCVKGINGTSCNYTRIQHCRIYMTNVALTVNEMFDFAQCDSCGLCIIGGNINSGQATSNINISFPTDEDKNSTIVYGNTLV